MRARFLVSLAISLVAGCLVPHYGLEPSDKANGGQAPGAGSSGSDSGGASVAGNSAMTPMAGAPTEECGPLQKSCGGECVDLDDVTYGCTDTSCSMSACPAAGTASLTCKDAACVIGSCGAGTKKCDGRCVAVNDPTFGCGETSCDATPCPEPGSGTLVCNGTSCVVGTCGSNTKKCGSNCVPLDENNGCSDALDCNPCSAFETCMGTPAVCGCTPDDVEACKGLACGPATNNCMAPVQCGDSCKSPKVCGSGASQNQCVCIPDDPCVGKACGSATNRCGSVVNCTDTCAAPTPACVGNACDECNVAADCPTPQGNPCARASCTNHKCSFSTAPVGTVCPAGTCSTTLPGVCTRPAVDAGGVSIDATEVTRGQYAAFVKAKAGNTSGQPNTCAWNTTYEPTFNYPPAIKDYDLPAASVDWCDAYAYCKWSGRRLCGKTGGGGFSPLDTPGASKTQWLHGCVGASGLGYPYANSYAAGKCNGGPAATGVAPVTSFTQCVGGYSGLYDMSGNVGEWQDACVNTASPATDDCGAAGGDWYGAADNPVYYLRCAEIGRWYRNTDALEIGFRCCGS